MTDNRSFEQPILNSPYEFPARHWELVDGLPTQRIIERRRPADFITPIPKPRKRKGVAEQRDLVLGDGAGISTTEQAYQQTAEVIRGVRARVDEWRAIPKPGELARHARDRPPPPALAPPQVQ